MSTFLRWFEAATTQRPRAVIAVLLLMTLGLAGLASQNELEVDLTAFSGGDSAVEVAMDRVREDVGDPTAIVQVILDAGADNDLLSPDGFAAVAAAEQVVLDTLGEAIRTDGDGRPQLLSLRRVVEGAMAQQGLDPATIDGAQLGVAAAGAVAANPQLAGLVSDDIDVTAGSARATVVLVPLDEALSETERTDAAQRLQDAFAENLDGVPSDVEVTVYSNGLFIAGQQAATESEMPILLGLALLVVLAILWLGYRSMFDVLIALAGLLMTVVWTFGVAALLGPAFLGWTGPLSQIVVVVPVLLVGLGVDFAVHLTARYREQRATGQPPTTAAGRALHTVGGALVLATAATAIGFGSTVSAPVQILADFGVLVAVGVVCAFVIMALLVPAARVWKDRAKEQKHELPSPQEPGSTRWTDATARLANRAPWAGILGGSVLVAVSLLAATGLEIEFDRDDFVPEGSDIAAVLANQAELFGGGVTEATFVVVDGQLTAPEVTTALEQAQAAAADIDGVRSIGGNPQITTQLARDGTSAVMQLRTTVGDAGADRVRSELETAFVPVVAAGADITVTSEPLIIAEMSDDLATFQAEAIVVTLTVVLLLLSGYYAIVRRRALLGVFAMIPAAVSASLVLGAMWLLGISFNVITALLTAIAIGIGVPYGIHIVNRFLEVFDDGDDDAMARTLHSIGGAMTGSALTTLGAFVVLAFSSLPPIRSLGLLGGVAITFALLAAFLVQPGALVLWARWHGDRSPDNEAGDDERLLVSGTTGGGRSPNG
jgi:uncharacterized protein